MKFQKVLVIALCAYMAVQTTPAETAKKTYDARQDLLMSTAEEPVYLYKDKKMRSPIAMLPKYGTAYKLAEGENWYRVVSGQYKGYVRKEQHFLTGDSAWLKADKVCQKEAVMKAENTIFVYEDPECGGRIVDLVTAGDEISATGQKGDAIEVVTSNQITGYISREAAVVNPVLEYAEEMDWTLYNAKNPAALGTYGSASEYDDYQGITRDRERQEQEAWKDLELWETGGTELPLGQEVVAYACQFIGNPYVWGGTSLTDGADCSGFIKSVYEHFNIHLPRTSYEMRSCGSLVSEGWQPELASPGDLICYDGHVALYMGDGRIVHAANQKEGIKISNADYREILCVRRVLGGSGHYTLTAEEREVLYRIVEAEAGGEGYRGKLLVANVILNRVASPEFPDTVKQVVFADRQFSPVSDGRYYQVNVASETRQAVDRALQGENIAQGALYFMAKAQAAPSAAAWFDSSLTWLFRYGCHDFYK